MQLEPVSVVLKFGFLIVLYLFLLWVARSAPARSAVPTTSPTAQPMAPSTTGSGVRDRKSVV